MPEENPQLSVSESLKPKAKKTKVAYIILIALALACAAGAVTTYVLQQQRIDSVTSKLNDANKKASTTQTALLNEIKDNSTASLALQEKYQDALTKLSATTTKKSATQADLDLTVSKALTTNFDNSGTTFSALAVNLALTNNTASAITVIPGAYTIKDTSNHIFSAMFSSQTGFGKDFVPLVTLVIQPGESVTGYVGVQVSDANVTDYTISIDTHTYKVVATKLASFPVTE